MAGASLQLKDHWQEQRLFLSRIIAAAIIVLPLAGLLRYRMYTYRWLSLMIWLYVTEGLVRGTSEGGLGMALAWVEVVLSVTIFVACAAQIRQRLAEARRADALTKDVG